MSSNPQPRVSRLAEIILDAALEYQAGLDATDPDHVVNDEYFEQQAEAQIRALIDAGFLSGSSLRSSEPSALTGETQWAVLNEDDDEIYDNREDATRALSFLREADMDYRLYEIREVDRG